MVALIEDDFCRNPKTLCDWVQNFRIKKNQMKRKLRGAAGGDLRVRAVLTLALRSAEQELHQKQQERFKRWLEMQSKCEHGASVTSYNSKLAVINFESPEVDEVLCKKREEIDSLWKNELLGLDQFMKSLSNNSKSKSYEKQQEHRSNVQTAVAS